MAKKYILSIIFFLIYYVGFTQAPIIYCVDIHGKSLIFQGNNLGSPTSFFIPGALIQNYQVNGSIFVLLSEPLASGGYTAILRTPTGNASFQFSVSDGLSYTSFFPSSVGPGDIITITGDTFPPGLYKPTNCTNYGHRLFSTTTELQMVIPCMCTNELKIDYTPDGICVQSLQTITISGLQYNGSPVINSVSPLKASTGDTVTIKGKYLYVEGNLPTISFGGISASSVIRVSDTVFKVVVGAAASGNILVKNICENASTYPGFNYISPPVTVCAGANTSITSNISGTVYQWQLNEGNGFNDINNDANYSGVNTSKLTVNNVPSGYYANQYRCLVDGNSSNLFSLKIVNEYVGTALTDQAWETPANWSCNIIPNANTDVIINNGTVNINSNAICRSITIKPGANVIVKDGVSLEVVH